MEGLNLIYEAAGEIENFFRAQGWKHCFIGGLAVQRWGEPRLTRDADCSLLTGFGGEEKFVDALLARFQPSRDRARDIALHHRVLYLQGSNGIHLDIALGAIPFEERCVNQATPWEARPGFILTTCTAEDLVVHKAYANRDRDWVDIEGVVMSQCARLNLEYILAEVAPLAELKMEAAIIPRLKRLAHHHGLK